METIVSVGLPVYNGADRIAATIRSVLDQTLAAIELVISDNASTDDTRRICEEFAGSDHRVRFFRNDENLGASRNFNRVFELSRSPYFKWLGHDDVLDPTTLEKALHVIESRPEVSIVHWLERMVDNEGETVHEYSPQEGFRIDSETPGSRFRQMLLWRHNGFGGDPFFGVIRRSALEATSLLSTYINPNYLLLQELSLTGQFITIPEVLAVRVYNNVRTTAPRMIRWLDPSRGEIGFPHFRRAEEYFRVGLASAEMKATDRMLTGAALVGYHLHPRQLKGFLWDVTKARIAPN